MVVGRFFFSAAPTAQNSPELRFRFITIFYPTIPGRISGRKPTHVFKTRIVGSDCLNVYVEFCKLNPTLADGPFTFRCGYNVHHFSEEDNHFTKNNTKNTCFLIVSMIKAQMQKNKSNNKFLQEFVSSFRISKKWPTVCN